MDTFYFNRSDRSLGSFFEYSYDNLENFTLVAGVRLDIHNRLGTFVTPRLHLRYLPQETTIIRHSLGNGRKAANIFAENQTLFGTNRVISIVENGGSIYGLNPENISKDQFYGGPFFLIVRDWTQEWSIFHLKFGFSTRFYIQLYNL